MYPYNNSSNRYIDLIKDAILNLNIEINCFEEVVRDRVLFQETEYYVLNWFESLYTNSLLKQSIKFIVKILKLVKLRFHKKKIIWTVHNKCPHNSKYKFYSMFLMRYLAINSYKIIIHSNETKNVLSELVDYNDIKDKIIYVPHPNYIGVYDSNTPCSNGSLDDKINLLFIGRVQPYKNVDLLIEVFNELNLSNLTLTLAGQPSDEDYKDYIINLIDNNPNIKTEFKFIEDDKIKDFIIQSDMLILPYDMKSSLNSGTIILAFSHKRTVLSPLIGTLKDFKNREMFFSYNYVDKISHKKVLKEKIIEVQTWSKAQIRDSGRKCYNIIKSDYSTDRISHILKENIFI